MSSQEYAKKHSLLGLCRNCTLPVREGDKNFCTYHREKARIYRRASEKKQILKYKEEYLAHYGKQCRCCGETLIQFLTLEHKAGKGNVHRKELFKHNVGGLHMYRWLKKNNYPEGYAVLCMNCNWATRYGDLCPHKSRRDG